MKKVTLLILIALIIYLNRTYARFYDYIGSHLQAYPVLTSYHSENAASKKIIYVALGDSLTAGVGTNNVIETYPYLIATKIKNSQNVEVYNLAYPGDQSSQLLKNQLPQALTENPDLVTILVGINDLHNFISENQFKKNYQEVIKELKNKTHSKIVLINIPYLGSSKTLFFPWNLILDYKTKQFNRVIEDLANENNLKYIDLYSTKKSFEQDNSLYSADLFHPSPSGYGFWAEVINANLSY